MSNYKLIYFNEKTTFEGYSRKLKIEILKRDYDGVAKKASIGAVLSVDGDVVKKTSATLSFMATFDTEFEDLLNDGTMFKVRITLDSRIIFIGFIDADSFERDYTTSKNYRLEFIARDRLGALEDSKITLDWVKMPFIDLDSFITQILEPTKLNLPLLENIGLSAKDTTSQLRLLGQIHVNTQCTRVDEDKTNLDYLEELLSALNCSIQQKNGSWFVEEVTVKTDRVKVFKKDIHLLHSSAKQTTQKGLKSIEVKQKLQSSKNIYKAFPVSDNDFIKVEQKPRSDMWFCYAPGWTIYNNSYMLRSFGVGAESFKVVNRNEYGLTPLNVSTIIDVEKTDNSVEVIFESAIASADTDLRPIAFDIYCGDKMLTKGGWVPKTDKTKNLVFKINGYTQGSPTFQKLTVVADGIPYATGLEIFYRTGYVDHKGIEVHEQYQQSYTLPSEKQLNLTVNEKNTQKVKEEIKFGQAPDFPNAFHNFLGGFFDEKKKPLINWKHRNDLKTYDLLQVVTDTHIWANARKRSISAVLSWNYDLFTSVEIEGIRYAIKGVDSWDLGVNELSAELEEINDYVEGAVPVTEPAITGDAQNLKMMGSSETNYLTYTNKGTATPIRIASLETATDDYIEQAYIIADTYNSTDSKRVKLSDIGNKTGSENQDFKTKNLAVHGDLEVYGEIISKPSVEIPIDDAWIKLNNGNSEVDAGIKIDLGDGTTSNFYRKASNDTWYIDDNELYHSKNLNIDTVDFKAKDITANSLKTRTFETVADGAKIFDNTVYHAGNLNRSDVDFKANLLYADSLTIHNHTKPTILTRITNERIYAIEYGVKAHDLKINSDKIIATPTGSLYSTASIANIHKSPNFQNGFLGQGHNFDNGVGELDTLTVRKTMNVYEMMINKVRAIGGEFLISSANGKISKVASQLSVNEAIVEFDIDTEFVLGDIVRCQTWTGSSLKYYLGYITNIYNSKKIRIQRIEGDITAISAGDELIQQGNRTDKTRQNLLSMSSRAGRYSIYQGVNSANLNGKLKGAFGDLKGITDESFGNLENVGLYCDNVYLKGKMLLSAGSSISFADVTGAESEVTKITNDTVTSTYINGLTCDFKQGKIGGFDIANSNLNNGSIYIDKTDGIYCTLDNVPNAWKLANDGSGSLASGNIKWDKIGNVTYSDKVKLQWQTNGNLISSGLSVSAYITKKWFNNFVRTSRDSGNANYACITDPKNYGMVNSKFVNNKTIMVRAQPTDKDTWAGVIGFGYEVEYDTNQDYMFATWVSARSDTNGTIYYGPVEGGDHFEFVKDGEKTINPYFGYNDAEFAHNKMLLYVGYVRSAQTKTGVANLGGVYDINGNKVKTLEDFRWSKSGITETDIRARIGLYKAASGIMFVQNPQIYRADGSEPSISNLIGLDTRLLTTITNDTLTTTNVIAKNLKVDFANIKNFTFDNATGRNVNLSGVINAESGYIGNLIIGEDSLYVAQGGGFELDWAEKKMVFTSGKAGYYNRGYGIDWFGETNAGVKVNVGTLSMSPRYKNPSTADSYDITLSTTNDLFLVAHEHVILDGYNGIKLNARFETDQIEANGMLAINKGEAIKPKTTDTTSNYSLTSKDRIVIAYDNGNVFLPANPFLGELHTVKSMYIGSIRVYGNGHNIDANAAFSDVSNGNAETFIFDGTNWAIIYRY